MRIINYQDKETEVQEILESNALRYGQGFFTTTAVRGFAPLWLEKHIKRLQKSLHAFEMGELCAEELEAVVNKWIREKEIEQGMLRIMAWEQAGEIMVNINGCSMVYEDIKPAQLILSDYYRHSSQPLLMYKSFNYWSNALAFQEALKQGYDEVLCLNERDEICEGSRSNIFWVQDGTIFTPASKCGILAGICREIVLELAEELNIPTRIGAFQVSSLLQAQEIFLTNSVRGIRKAEYYEPGFRLNNSPITELLVQSYSSKVDKYMTQVMF